MTTQSTSAEERRMNNWLAKYEEENGKHGGDYNFVKANAYYRQYQNARKAYRQACKDGRKL